MSNKHTELLRTRFFVSANLQYENVKIMTCAFIQFSLCKRSFRKKSGQFKRWQMSLKKKKGI